MRTNGTLINYFFHCKRQCYLHGNRLNLEDNSENVRIGRAIHEEKSHGASNSEIQIENIKIDKLTKDYLIEIKKSDADVEACKWQVIYYLKILRDKGIERKGKLEFIEKNKKENKVLVFELDDALLAQLDIYVNEIECLIEGKEIPQIEKKPGCKKCAYYEYCYI